MHRIARRRPSPALVVASLALLVALGGTGAAAVALAPNNSVGTKAVIDHSLLKQDFRAGQLPAGAPGSALAYAHVEADGTIDAASSKHVAAVPLKVEPKKGAPAVEYCLDVTGKQAPKNAVVTLDTSRSAGKEISITLSAAAADSACAGDADGIVTILDDSPGFPAANAFYVVFN